MNEIVLEPLKHTYVFDLKQKFSFSRIREQHV
jgi:hypothetical protein